MIDELLESYEMRAKAAEKALIKAHNIINFMQRENEELKLKLNLVDNRKLKNILKQSYTNADAIRQMSDTELAQLFEKNFKTENIAESWFEKAYCKNEEICETLEGVCENGKKIRFVECETTEGCPHHKNETVIEMWLKSEVE